MQFITKKQLDEAQAEINEALMSFNNFCNELATGFKDLKKRVEGLEAAKVKPEKV